MKCLRCNGLVVSDDSFAVQTGSSSDFHGWRCVNCGMIVDDVIRDNRRVTSQPRSAAGTVAKPRDGHHATSRF